MTIRMMDAVFGRMPQSDRNVQDPDRQTQLHAITDRLADDAAGV